MVESHIPMELRDSITTARQTQVVCLLQVARRMKNRLMELVWIFNKLKYENSLSELATKA